MVEQVERVCDGKGGEPYDGTGGESTCWNRRVTQKLRRMCGALSSPNLRFILQQLQTSTSSEELTNVIT